MVQGRVPNVQSPAPEERAALRAQPINRRRFLLLSAAGAVASSLLAACGGGQPAPTAAPAKPAAAQPPAAAAGAPAGAAKAPAFAGGGELTFLMQAHFIPAFDAWLDKFAADWGERNKVKVTVDHLLGAEMPAKWAAEVAAGSGHDLYGFTQSGAINYYGDLLVEMGDLVKQLGDKHGGWVEPFSSSLAQYNGAWKGVPDFFIDFPANYRKDLFDANGLKPVDTWDDLLKAGTLLKSKEQPIGISINQRSNDANNSWLSVLFGHGASYVDKDSKTVTIKSPETRQAVEYAIELYEKAMTNEVLSWDDSSNNQFLASGRGAWIQNPISSYRTIEKSNPELAKNIWISNCPAGPKARVTGVSPSAWGVFNWSKSVDAARAFLVEYYAAYADGIKAAEGYNQPLLKDYRKKPMPIIGEDPKLQVLQDFDQIARATGYPGLPTRAAAEVEQTWIIPLMIGQAVQSRKPDEAIDWAAGKIEAVYAKYK
jgi:multiple sugar transport system substrate-binding protein